MRESTNDTLIARREFLRLLGASPVFSQLALPREWIGAFSQEPALIKAPSDAANVFDFEAVAQRTLPPAHYGYLSTGTDDDGTLRANRDGFELFALRPRRLVDVGRIDPSIQLLDRQWSTPIIFSPVGSQKAFHADGELAVARAAKVGNILQVLSTSTSVGIEEVNAARGEPVWFQLYAQRGLTTQVRQILKRVENAGCPCVVLTVDILGGSRRETQWRLEKQDSRVCTDCHNDKKPPPPMLAGLPTDPPQQGTPTWELVRQLKDATNMKLYIKGIVTRDDAQLALNHGVDGLFVSNHGGRAENTHRSSIESLPEIVEVVAGRVPIIVDSGFRRGTDIFKALALGATAVGVGRPYIWGLAAFGQEGVEAVSLMLRRELQSVMRQSGTPNVRTITRASVAERFKIR